MVIPQLLKYLVLVFIPFSLIGQIKYDVPRDGIKHDYLFNPAQDLDVYTRNNVKSVSSFTVNTLTNDTIREEFFSFLKNGLRDSCYAKEVRTYNRYEMRKGYDKFGLEDSIKTFVKFHYNSNSLVSKLIYQTQNSTLLPLAPHQKCLVQEVMRYDSLNRLIYTKFNERCNCYLDFIPEKLKKDFFYCDSASIEQFITHYGDSAHIVISHSVNDYHDTSEGLEHRDSILYSISHEEMEKYYLKNHDFIELNDSGLISSWTKTKLFSGIGGDSFRGPQFGNSKQTYEYDSLGNILCIHTSNPQLNYITKNVTYTYNNNEIAESVCSLTRKFSFWNLFRTRANANSHLKFRAENNHEALYSLSSSGLLELKTTKNTSLQTIFLYEFWD